MDALEEANELNHRGGLHLDVDELDEAEACFRRAVELWPALGWAWFNLGLVHKRRHEWAACVDANLRAAELNPEPEEPAWWNLGIAATAIGDWATARRGWEGFGLTVPGTHGPIDGDLGVGVVRLAHGEVVWGRRIDPCRLRILNVPLPDSGHRWEDVVLHDGVPNGQRRVQDLTYPVFDELERLEPSTSATLELEVDCKREPDAEALVLLYRDGGYGAEDWTASVRVLCKACSEGAPDDAPEHDHAPPPWQSRRRVGLAAPRPMADELLRVWQKGHGRRVRSLQPVD